MRALVSIKNRLCIFWTPKAGCSTALRIFLEHENFEYTACSQIHHFRELYQNTVHPPVMPNDSSSFIKIQFVRDPYQRAVSSYFNHMEHAKNNNHNKAESFRGFLEGYKNNLLGCVFCNDHSSKQFITNDIDAIVRIEYIHDDIRSVNDRFNLKLNSSLRYDDHSYRKRILSSGKNPREEYASFLRQNGVVKLIEDIYREDIEFINRMSPNKAEFLFN